jgi:hypothetical protein
MFRGSRSRARIALFVALSALVPVSVASTATPAQAASASFVGPLLSNAENATTSWGRDGGFSVPLPNGRVFWIFGDTPRYTYSGGKWKLTGFLYGSSAGVVPFKAGKPPSKRFNEVIPGRSVKKSNQPHQFLPTPRLYLPNGKVCNKANGGPSAGAARWATGAALMPDKTNILVSYIGVCVQTAIKYRVQSWGFSLFNWKTNRFTVAAADVWKPSKSPGIAPKNMRGSPVISGGKVTFFSGDCWCKSNAKTYRTTVAAKAKALRKKSNYTPRAIPGLFPHANQVVVPATKSQPHLTMYQEVNTAGKFRLLRASSPAGPWKKLSIGTLPKCKTSKAPCISVALHPWMSTSSRMLVSYFVPGYGPGVRKHTAGSGALGHVVMSYIPA